VAQLGPVVAKKAVPFLYDLLLRLYVGPAVAVHLPPVACVKGHNRKIGKSATGIEGNIRLVMSGRGAGVPTRNVAIRPLAAPGYAQGGILRM